MKYLELWRLWDDVEVGQLLRRYVRRIRRRGAWLHCVRNLASELPSTVCKFTADMRGY
jgi:hypothetical protein